MATKKIGSIKFSLEVILVVVVLFILFKNFALPKEDPTPSDLQPEVTDGIKTSTDDSNTSRIKSLLTDSGVEKQYTAVELPTLPFEIKLFDASKFTEAEITEYEAGTEYYLSFIFPEITDFDQFADYYSKFAEDEGWELTLNMYGINGTRTIFGKEDVEVQAVAFIRMSEDGTPYIKEKTKVLVLKQ